MWRCNKVPGKIVEKNYLWADIKVPVAAATTAADAPETSSS